MISCKVEVKKINNEEGLFAKEDIEKDELIIEFKGGIVDKPTKYSLQIDKNKHLESTELTDNSLNHSCNPNSYVTFQDISLRALRKINAREEITFNYLTTEWDMFSKFKCNCKNKDCFKDIRGYKYLTKDERKRLKNITSPFLKSSSKIDL
ncbi:MAG TPA: SET domain-containing protein [Candidatus Nanoarchaeia archaeon]|nr:SET domain-containing protein [Candidatus Nanoarchaeia archaeon]